MNRELQDKLINKYPQQFQDIKYIECGDGWYDLLSRLCFIIQDQIDRNKKLGQPITFAWSQIKEKFGGLRAYCYGADEYIRGAIDMAESMSYSICEYSGEKGRIRKQRMGEDGKPIYAWIKTLSDQEAEKEGYIIDNIGFDANETD
jgi:hypothetical protein